jgi:hypothetical protein
MRSDSAIKSDSKVEYRWHSDFHTADDATAVKDLCSARSPRVLGAMIALGLAVTWPQPAQAGSPPEPIEAVVAKVRPAVVEVVVVRPKDDEDRFGFPAAGNGYRIRIPD